MDIRHKSKVVIFKVMVYIVANKHFTMLISRGEVNEAKGRIYIITFKNEPNNSDKKRAN